MMQLVRYYFKITAVFQKVEGLLNGCSNAFSELLLRFSYSQQLNYQMDYDINKKSLTFIKEGLSFLRLSLLRSLLFKD